MREPLNLDAHCSIPVLKKLVRLDVETGRLFWLRRDAMPGASKTSTKTWNTRFAGKEAFCTASSNGYLHGSLLDIKICAHRIVFALFHGRWPTNTIDHINGNRKDNRPTNLRDVAHRENMLNQPKSKASTTGITGVSRCKERGKYAAHITVSGRTVHLGRFDDVDAAKAARSAAEKSYGFHENHGRNAI